MDWDEFEKSLTSTVRNVDALAMAAGADDEKLARLWLQIDEAMELLKVQRQYVEAKLAENVNIQIGTHERNVGKDMVVSVAWPEKLDWDEEVVSEIVGDRSKPLPSFVKDTVKVDKRVFDRSPPEEQAPWLRALTRKPGPRKVKVEVRS